MTLPCGDTPGSCSASIPLACESCGNNKGGPRMTTARELARGDPRGRREEGMTDNDLGHLANEMLDYGIAYANEENGDECVAIWERLKKRLSALMEDTTIEERETPDDYNDGFLDGYDHHKHHGSYFEPETIDEAWSNRRAAREAARRKE